VPLLVSVIGTQTDNDEKLFDQIFGYFDFIYKLNITNRMLVIPQKQTDFNPYKYRIKKGNNSSVIKNSIKSR